MRKKGEELVGKFVGVLVEGEVGRVVEMKQIGEVLEVKVVQNIVLEVELLGESVEVVLFGVVVVEEEEEDSFHYFDIFYIVHLFS